jgi:uncharacterized protein YycO
MKKILALSLALTLFATLLTGCTKAAAVTDLAAGYTPAKVKYEVPEGADGRRRPRLR